MGASRAEQGPERAYVLTWREPAIGRSRSPGLGTDACLLLPASWPLKAQAPLAGSRKDLVHPCPPHCQPGGGLGGTELLPTIPVGSLYWLQRMPMWTY